MTNNQLTAFRADGGDISQGRIKEIADNAYGDEEKRRLAQRLLAAEVELQEHRKAKPDVLVPQALNIEDEHQNYEYVAGWNDCRNAVLIRNERAKGDE